MLGSSLIASTKDKTAASTKLTGLIIGRGKKRNPSLLFRDQTYSEKFQRLSLHSAGVEGLLSAAFFEMPL